MNLIEILKELPLQRWTHSHKKQLLELAKVEVLKEKNGIATVIKFNDMQYTVQHPSHIRGNQNLNRREKLAKDQITHST